MKNNKIKAAHIANKIKKITNNLAEVAEAVNNISGKISAHNYVALGTIAVGKVADMLSTSLGRDESIIDPVNTPYDMRDFLKGIAKRYPHENITSEDGTTMFAEIHGATVAFKGSGWDVEIGMKKLPGEKDSDCEERCLLALGRAVWETIGSSIELVSSKKNNLVSLKAWDLGAVMGSEQTQEVLTRTKALMALGGPRSLMLHGPPGTGKTCMARAIASEINGTALSMTAKYLKEVDDCTLGFVLELLVPDVLLIDDIDRVSDPASMLPAIDRIREKTKLIMVTVNHLDKIDSAVKRAGRFDDLVEVIRVRNPTDIIPELPDDVAERIDGWPIAYVTELKARIDAFGIECLDRELEALEARVADNDEGGDYEEEDDESITAITGITASYGVELNDD